MGKRIPRILLALVALTLGGLWLNSYLRRPPPRVEYQGWVEAYFIYVSPDETGRIERLAVNEGDRVAAGSPLFALDSDLQRDALAEAKAALTNARVAQERAKELLKKAVGSQKTFDDADAALRTAEARFNSAKTRLERRTMASPVAGTVQEIYFRAGEMVQSGRPVISLLPPGNTKVRFFVPQAALPAMRIGEPVSISCDGCPAMLTGRISFISGQAEFTPPVIYSLEERSRLVFRLEAIPDTPEKLRVGQPVTVAPRAAGEVADVQR